MIKDNINSALPQEDVIVKKSQLVESFAKPTRTTKTVVIISILLVLVLGSGVAVVWEMSQPIISPGPDIQMYAVRIAENGTQYESGQVIIRGQRMEYRDQTAISEFDVEYFQILDSGNEAEHVLLYFASNGVLQGQYNGTRGVYNLSIELSSDADWCVIQEAGNNNVRYVVCATTEDFDPMLIFEKSMFSK